MSFTHSKVLLSSISFITSEGQQTANKLKVLITQEVTVNMVEGFWAV